MPLAPCPICAGSLADDAGKWRPFCSDRCRQIDLGAWFREEYRMSAEATDASDGDEG